MARASSTAVARRYERLRQYQRRAHARNREHLGNLERTIRECEIEGMAMKTEADNATRRAVEENRHLRDLLAQHGITQEYVDGYLASEAVTGPQPTSQTATQAATAQPGPASEAIAADQELFGTIPPV